MKILVVTKDMAEFHTYRPVVEKLQKHGAEVHIVAEGLSMDMWIKAGWNIVGGLPGSGNFDPHTKTRDDIVPEKVLNSIVPDVVMTGLADPIHLGNSFGIAANTSGIKLGFVEELWFVHRRSEAIPDFVCTLDVFGRQTISDHYTTDVPEIFITGSPAMDVLLSNDSDPIAAEVTRKRGSGKVILIAGQGEPTTPLLRGLLQALEQSNEECLIIPCLHPKWMNDPSMSSLKDLWVRLIYQMEKKHRVLWPPINIRPTQFIPLATEVISIFSVTLMEAVALGKLAISWTSEEGKASMRTSLKGHDFYPLVRMKAAIEVTSPDDYLDKVATMDEKSRGEFISSARKIFPVDFSATDRVVQAILG